MNPGRIIDWVIWNTISCVLSFVVVFTVLTVLFGWLGSL